MTPILREDLISTMAAHISSISREKASHRLVALAGEGGTGKTTIALALVERLGRANCEIFEFDSFALSRAERLGRGLSGYDIQSFNLDQAATALRELLTLGRCWVPHYSHESGRRCDCQMCGAHHHGLQRKAVNLIVGLPLWCSEFSWLSFQLSYFFEYKDPSARRSNRISLDVERRGYTMEEATAHFQKLATDFDNTILPSRPFCMYMIKVSNDFTYSLSRIER